MRNVTLQHNLNNLRRENFEIYTKRTWRCNLQRYESLYRTCLLKPLMKELAMKLHTAGVQRIRMEGGFHQRKSVIFFYAKENCNHNLGN